MKDWLNGHFFFFLTEDDELLENFNSNWDKGNAAAIEKWSYLT